MSQRRFVDVLLLQPCFNDLGQQRTDMTTTYLAQNKILNGLLINCSCKQNLVTYFYKALTTLYSSSALMISILILIFLFSFLFAFLLTLLGRWREI